MSCLWFFDMVQDAKGAFSINIYKSYYNIVKP
jgi:hypothetical protein